MSQPIFRRYKEGDEEGIVNVMNSSFGTFKEFGLTAEIWKEYAKIDEGFKLENALVAELDGKIVGHVQLVERDLRLGSNTFVKNGGIANVCTLPEARGKGISTNLMKLAVRISKENGYPLSTLFTGYGGVAHRVYRSVGYADTYFSCYFKGSVEEMKALQEKTKSVSGVKIRTFKEGDEEKFLELYNISSRTYSGTAKRSLNYWKKKLTERSSTHAFFYDKFDPEEVVVAEEDGEVTGYAYLTFMGRKRKPNPENGYIREIVYKPGHYKALMKVANECVNRMLSENVKTLSFSVPLESSYLSLFNEFKMFVSEGIFMTYVTDLKLLFENLKNEFEERISSSICSLDEMNIEIKTIYGSIPIKIKSGEVKFELDKKEADVEVNYHEFTRIIFGLETFSGAVLNGKVKISGTTNVGRLVDVLDTMFPPRVFHIWSIDHW